MATFTPHDGVAEEDPSAMAVDSDEEAGQPSSGKEWQIWLGAQLPRGLTVAEYRANVKNMATFTPHDGVAEEDPSAAMAVDSDEEVGQPSSGKEWQIWFDAQLPRGLTLAEYRANVKNVGSLSSLRDLDSYGYYNDFKFVPEEESMATGARKDQDAFRFNLRFFRSSCPPFWEDQPDTAIIYTLQMPPSLAPID
eukprot:gene21371-32861_t